MADVVRDFYDQLAGNYHLMFEDWEASVARQAAALAPLLERECGPAVSVRVLDCACGIGTQALGLAGLAFNGRLTVWTLSRRAASMQPGRTLSGRRSATAVIGPNCPMAPVSECLPKSRPPFQKSKNAVVVKCRHAANNPLVQEMREAPFEGLFEARGSRVNQCANVSEDGLGERCSV